MLSSWLATLGMFIKTQWVPITTAMLALIIWESGRRKLKKSEKALAELTEDAFTVLAAKDVFLIDAAKNRISSDALNRKDFLDIVGIRLDFLARKFRRAQMLSRRLGLSALVSSSLSSLVTGAGIGGPNYTIPISFFITSIGAASLAVLTYIGATDDSVTTLVLAERVRNEMAEYISGADSYQGLSDDDAYYLFARTVNGLFLESTASQEAGLRAKMAAQAATDPKDGDASAS